MSAFLEAIADPARIHAQIVRLSMRARGRRLAALAQDGAPFLQLVTERDAVVPLLSRALADGSYRPGPARLVNAFLAGRKREIARIGALDHVVHGVVTEVLAERLDPTLSPSVYSYRAKRSSWDALRWLARVARAHRRAEVDPKRRMLFVLRADVQRYAESIPTGDDSRLWDLLADAAGLRRGDRGWDLLVSLFRADIRGDDGTPLERTCGTLFGAPTTNLACNLYLQPLDAALESLRPHGDTGGYARFGDDIAFVSPSADEVLEAAATTQRVVAELGLVVHPTKMRVLAWNAAARAPLGNGIAATPVDRVAFLGGDVRFDGSICLPTAKWRRVVRDLRGRILRTAAALPDSTVEDRARALAIVVDDALAPDSELAVGAVSMLSALVDDRKQLEQLDHLVALWIAEAATRVRGPRAFRRMPPRWLRQQADLVSRVVARNRGRFT